MKKMSSMNNLVARTRLKTNPKPVGVPTQMTSGSPSVESACDATSRSAKSAGQLSLSGIGGRSKKSNRLRNMGLGLSIASSKLDLIKQRGADLES